MARGGEAGLCSREEAPRSCRWAMAARRADVQAAVY